MALDKVDGVRELVYRNKTERPRIKYYILKKKKGKKREMVQMKKEEKEPDPWDPGSNVSLMSSWKRESHHLELWVTKVTFPSEGDQLKRWYSS